MSPGCAAGAELRCGTDGRDNRGTLGKLERRRLRCLVEGRVDEADPLHAPDFQLVHPGGVAGVSGFHRDDNEVWWVTGSPSGEELTRAVAGVLDDRADVLRACYADLSNDSESR